MNITVATPADREPIVAGLVAAFAQDPLPHYLFPTDYEKYAPLFFGHLFDKRVGLGSIWTMGPGAATAIWEPPGPADPAPLDLPADAQERMHAYDESVNGMLPSGRFWYLGVLGAHPDHRGHGLGRAVMQPGLERAEAEGLPAYLETSTELNVKIYERYGWHVVSHITEPVPTWILTQ